MSRARAAHRETAFVDRSHGRARNRRKHRHQRQSNQDNRRTRRRFKKNCVSMMMPVRVIFVCILRNRYSAKRSETGQEHRGLTTVSLEENSVEHGAHEKAQCAFTRGSYRQTDEVKVQAQTLSRVRAADARVSRSTEGNLMLFGGNRTADSSSATHLL